MIPAAWLLSATRLAAARGDAAMSAHLSQQLGGAEREPPAWLAHEIARRSRLPRPDDPAARAREGGAFLATSRRPSGAASARPVVLHFYSLACRRCRRRRRGNDRFPSRSEKQLVGSRHRIDLCSQVCRAQSADFWPTETGGVQRRLRNHVLWLFGGPNRRAMPCRVQGGSPAKVCVVS